MQLGKRWTVLVVYSLVCVAIASGATYAFKHWQLRSDDSRRAQRSTVTCPPATIYKNYLSPNPGLKSRDAEELVTASGFRMRIPADAAAGNTTQCVDSAVGAVVEQLTIFRHWNGSQLVTNSNADPFLWANIAFGTPSLAQQSEPPWKWQKPVHFPLWELTLYPWANALAETDDPGELGSYPTFAIDGTLDPRRGRPITVMCTFNLGTMLKSLQRYEARDTALEPQGVCRMRWGVAIHTDVLVEFSPKWLPGAKKIYQAYQEQIQSYIVREK